MPQIEDRGAYWIERRHRPGYYSDHGLGGEMIWYEEQTEITIVDRATGDLETIRVQEAGCSARISWRTQGAGRSLDLTGRGPIIADHGELVDYWIERLIAARAAYAEA